MVPKHMKTLQIPAAAVLRASVGAAAKGSERADPTSPPAVSETVGGWR